MTPPRSLPQKLTDDAAARPDADAPDGDLAAGAAGGRWRVEAMRSLSEGCLLWFTKGQAGSPWRARPVAIPHITRSISPRRDARVRGWTAGFRHRGGRRGRPVTLPERPLHLRIREVHAQQEVNVTLDMIQRELESDTPGHDRAAQHHLGLLGVWLERQALKGAAEAVQPDAARRLVARYTALMETEFRKGKGVGEIAAMLGVTATHLTRCCRAACGRSAIDLLQDRRIFEARRLSGRNRYAGRGISGPALALPRPPISRGPFSI